MSDSIDLSGPGLPMTPIVRHPKVALAIRLSGDLTATLTFVVDGEMEAAGRYHRDLLSAYIRGYGTVDQGDQQ